MNNELVPPATIIEILGAKIAEEIRAGHKEFLIDGFPRDSASAHLFEEKIAAPSMVLNLTLPRSQALERFLLRNRDNRDQNSNIVVFDKRFQEFEVNNAVLVERYAGRGIVREVDSSGPTEETLENVMGLL